MVDWPQFVREFGLPISMLFLFAGAIAREVFVSGASQRSERALWTARVTDWKDRWTEEHEARLVLQKALDTIVPAVTTSASLIAEVKDELLRGTKRPTIGR